MEQEDIPKVNSINLTPPDKRELDWTSNLLLLINKSEDGQVEIPGTFHERLHDRCSYNACGFIHHN